MKHVFAFFVVIITGINITACTTMPTSSIRESVDASVKSCKMLGNVNGSDAVFVGLSAAIGSKNAKAKAMNQAIGLRATDIVWTAQGTSMTSEWVGKAYACK